MEFTQSVNRERDREERLWYLRQMRQALAEGLPQTAKSMGVMAAYLQKQIDTFDYSKLDSFDEKHS